jgi:hypothetical protein
MALNVIMFAGGLRPTGVVKPVVWQDLRCQRWGFADSIVGGVVCLVGD